MLFSCNPIGQLYLGGPSYNSHTVILHKKRGVLKYLASLTHLHLHQWFIFERQLAITRYLQTFAVASLVNIRVIFIITSFKISGKEFATKYQLSNGTPSGPVEPRSGTCFLWDLRSEHNINKFAFGLKRQFRSKPNWASATFCCT